MSATREERLTVGVLVAALLIGGGILAYRAYGVPRLHPTLPARPPGESSGGGEARTSWTRKILVHVAGAVRRPGLYELARGARARDAIAAAGGQAEDARPDAVNLAAVLTDGARVYVPPKAPERPAPAPRPPPQPRSPPEPRPRPEPRAPAPAATGATAGNVQAAAPQKDTPVPLLPRRPIDLNTATSEQLETIPGVGPATAERILRHRALRGKFRSLEDLLAVPGIGPRRLEELRDYLFVPKALTTAITPPSPAPPPPGPADRGP